VTRYDLLLALIPSVFLASFLLGVVFGVPARTTLIGAAIVGGFAVCDALFLNPPTTGGR